MSTENAPRLKHEARNTGTQHTRRVFLLASSGGSGHISAALAIRDKLKNRHEGILFPTHQAQLHELRPFSIFNLSFKSWGRSLSIYLSMRLNQTFLRPIIQWITHGLGYPDLPDYEIFKYEINRLKQAEIAHTNAKNQAPTGRKRDYVDMILDLQLAGYISAATFNSMQRADQTTAISQLVQLQTYNDNWNYQTVYDGILARLKHAAEKNEPFTEIISTQAQSLQALCDAVITYNEHYLVKINQTRQKSPLTPIIIHQYMTDLATPGATHFFQPLLCLTTQQKQQMELYALGITPAIYDSYLCSGKDFKQVHHLSADTNPMVRAHFLNTQLRTHDQDTSLSMQLKINTPDSADAWVHIPARAKVAAVMLGSLASCATVDYVKHLLDNQYDSIFIFGGVNPDIHAGIEAIIHSYPVSQQANLRARIIQLGNQSDETIAPIMTRSDCVIIRGGGLSTMEQMALPQRPHKAVLIHHNNPVKGAPLTSGLSWEDGNTDALIASLNKQHVFARKTCLAHISQTLTDVKRHVFPQGSPQPATIVPERGSKKTPFYPPSVAMNQGPRPSFFSNHESVSNTPHDPGTQSQRCSCA